MQLHSILVINKFYFFIKKNTMKKVKMSFKIIDKLNKIDLSNKKMHFIIDRCI